MTIDAPLSWEIPSNSGRESITGLLTKVVDDESDSLLSFDVRCRYESFSLHAARELVEKYDVLFREVAVSRRKLLENVSTLNTWLKTPGEMELDFSGAKGQTFKFWFGVQAGVISSNTKPVCLMTIRSFLLNCELGFVVDQSCIRIFSDSLAAIASK